MGFSQARILDLPDSGMEPASAALADGFLLLSHPGSALPVLPPSLIPEPCSLISLLWSLTAPPVQAVTFWAWAFLAGLGPSEHFEGWG